MEGFLPLWLVTCIMCWIFNNFPPRLSSSNSGATDSSPVSTVYNLRSNLNLMMPLSGPPWWRVHLQCTRPGLDPWVWEDPLEKGMAMHCSILAWKIPWTEELGGLQSMRFQRVRHNWATNIFTFMPLPVSVMVCRVKPQISHPIIHVTSAHFLRVVGWRKYRSANKDSRDIPFSSLLNIFWFLWKSEDQGAKPVFLNRCKQADSSQERRAVYVFLGRR